MSPRATRAWLAALVVGGTCVPPAAPQLVPDFRDIENLRAFARLYGYVRFFHPSDAAAQADWERLAILGVGRARRAASAEELRAVLAGLFDPLCAGLELSTRPIPQRPAPPEPPGAAVVAWQHRGVALDGGAGLYMSARTNRKTRVDRRQPGPGFGNAMQMLPAEPLRGKEIRLDAAVKAQVSGRGNQGQLWLRVDRPEQAVGFFDNMRERPITEDRWATYSITGKVDADAERVAFGCFLSGDGSLWVDDVRLAVRAPGGEWQPVEVPNGSFEQGAAAAPEGWLTPTRGYTFRVVEGQASAGSRALSISREASYDLVEGPLFAERPRLGEATTVELGAGLWCRVPLALTDEAAAGTLAPRNARLAALQGDLAGVKVASMTADDEDLRLADVVIVWSVLQHFYPYFDVARADWSGELGRALRRAKVDRTGDDFVETLDRMVAALKDGHAGVSWRSGPPNAWLPAALDEVEGQVVVTATGPSSGLRRGDVVKSVDGVPVGQVLARLEPTVSGSPQWRRRRVLEKLSLGPAGSRVDLNVEREGESFSVELAHDARMPVREASGDPIRQIEEGVLYVDLRTASEPDIDAAMERLVAARAVVFDLRGYPNGNHLVLCHIARTTMQSPLWNVPLVTLPDRQRLESWDTAGRWELPAREPTITGRVYFLADARAISYAESVLGIVEAYKLGEIVGRQTAGANGNVNALDLPGGFRLTWTGMKVLKHDGSQHHLLGIAPTIPVVRTLRAIREGRDEDVEAALRAFHAGA